MNASADYAAATALLAKPLPAYVSYTAQTHVRFDAIRHDDTAEIVVRTKDNTVLKGGTERPPFVQVGASPGGAVDAITNPPFAPRCYEATGARAAKYETADVEAISLRYTCPHAKDDKNFDTLYVDPATRRPIAATGSENDDGVSVQLVQRFTPVEGNVLPSSIYVRVQGSGLMGWLDVLYDGRYANYRFSATPP